jgi:hypothetical protein
MSSELVHSDGGQCEREGELCKMEIWIPIKQFADYYEVSNQGAVRNSRTGTIMTPRKDRGGYLTVRLYSNGRTSTRFVHRLVAEAFIAKQPGLDIVNHLNGDKTDNRMENLEWTTHSGNIRHAYKTGLCKPQGKIVVDDETHQQYQTITQASKAKGIHPGTCRNYLNGNIKKNPTSLRYAHRITLFIVPAVEMKMFSLRSDRWKVIWNI